VAVGHSTDQDLLIAVEIKHLVRLWPVNELQLDPAVCLFYSILGLVLKKINGHVRVSIGYNVSIF